VGGQAIRCKGAGGFAQKVTSAETFLAQRRKDAKKTLRTAAALGAFAPLREKNFLEVDAASIFCAKLLCTLFR